MNRESIFPLAFYAVNKHLAISHCSVTQMMQGGLDTLSYQVQFRQNDPVAFEIGTSTCSPKETFNHYDIERFCKFAKIERTRRGPLNPPYRHGTRMFVLIHRKGDERFEISLKVNGDRSETFAFFTKPGSDYIAVRCSDTKDLMSGYIDFKNMEEYLAAMDGKRLCVEEPTVVMMSCGHAVFSPSGSPNVKCPKCNVSTGKPRKANFRSAYCMNCPHKRCKGLDAMMYPCECIVSCLDSAKREEVCPYCETTLTHVQEVLDAKQ